MGKGPVLVISGTNRPGADALRVANVVMQLYQKSSAAAELYSLTEMPREIFDATSYATKPASWAPVQQRVIDAAGLHIVTPEYNGGFPGVLKYFIDMLKFPESFEAKPVAFVGESAGTWGAIRPVEQLQGIFGYRNAHIYPDRVFIPGITTKLDANGKITDPSIEERLAKQVAGFSEFVRRFS